MQYKLTFTGLTNFKDFIIKYLGSNITVVDDNDFKNADIVYWIYGPGPDLYSLFAKIIKPRSKIVIHWVGSDVTYLDQNLHAGNIRKRLYYMIWMMVNNSSIRENKVFHFAHGKWLQKELNHLGLRTNYLPIASIHNILKVEHPQIHEIKYDVISYIPYCRFDFYGGNIFLKLASMMPENKFLIINSDLNLNEIEAIDIYPENLTALPKQSFDDTQKLYTESKCFLRLTKHDGMSFSVLEALYHKLHVLWTCDFPNVVKVQLDDFDDILNKTKAIITDWKPNQIGHDFVVNNFNDEKMQSWYDNMLNQFIR
jgi:hypothetical protein